MGEGLRLSAIVGMAITLRWCVTYHPYSGEGKSPMYGDYEAQRHWQEITKNLPINRWYSNNSDNDLQYWGLDYPPLTAYHSYALGSIAEAINPEYVELGKSRGYESSEHKNFMRLSVMAADALIYIPALIYFVRRAIAQELSTSKSAKSNAFGMKKEDFVLTTALLYPGLIIIDHAHFQYNCVSLGLFVVAVALMLRNCPTASSLLFVLALNYKQMELYHALPFFFYILGGNTPGKRKSLLSCIRTLICVSLTVIIAFVVIWAPFIQRWDVFIDALTRLFPIDRGVFEDKVSNVWCALNVVYKFRSHLTNINAARICLITTIIAVTPCCANLYLRPQKERFIVSLINCSLAFFLFSFQVHEKTILLVAIPVMMYLHRDPLICFWFLAISIFSMLPLIIKDRLILAYFALNFFYFVVAYVMWPEELTNFAMPDGESAAKGRKKVQREGQTSQRKFRVKYGGRSRFGDGKTWHNRYYDKILHFFGRESLKQRLTVYLSILKLTTFFASILGALVLSLASVLIEPPDVYPDLFALLVSLYSCLHFVAFFLYFNYKQIYGLHKQSGKSKSH